MLEPILGIVLSVIAAIVAAVGTYFVRWINSRTKNEKLTQYTELMVHYAQLAVNKIAQTTADEIKAAAADGKFTEEDKESLKAAAIAELRAIAPDTILAFQEKMNSDLDLLLDTLVESAVYGNKRATPLGE